MGWGAPHLRSPVRPCGCGEAGATEAGAHPVIGFSHRWQRGAQKALARFTTAAGLEDGYDAATTEITFFVADDDVADELEEAAMSDGSPVDGDRGLFLLSDGVPVRIERTDGLAETSSADR